LSCVEVRLRSFLRLDEIGQIAYLTAIKKDNSPSEYCVSNIGSLSSNWFSGKHEESGKTRALHQGNSRGRVRTILAVLHNESAAFDFLLDDE
jgi:hypothetical protein